MYALNSRYLTNSYSAFTRELLLFDFLLFDLDEALSPGVVLRAPVLLETPYSVRAAPFFFDPLI